MGLQNYLCPEVYLDKFSFFVKQKNQPNKQTNKKQKTKQTNSNWIKFLPSSA